MTEEGASWNEQIDRFWAEADAAQPDRMRIQLQALLADRGEDHPDSVFEAASLHDFLGEEEQAVLLYRKAIDTGLQEPRLACAQIQLGSSLRNIGRPQEAIEILQQMSAHHTETGSASQAFLALALHDAGRSTEALQTALSALASTLPSYGRAVKQYSLMLTEQKEA